MKYLVAVVMLLWGVINVCSPETGWQMQTGWQYKNAEPSREALIWGRIAGVVMFCAGIWMLLS